MSWSYATRDVPFLRDYAAAAAYEASVKPVRGRSPEIKPLGSRKKLYLRIKKEDNGNGGADIHIMYGTTSIVTFQHDGYIAVSGNTYSSTQGVQGTVLGDYPGRITVCQHDGNPWISGVLAPCDPDGDRRGAFPLRMEGDKNLFRREADGHLRYVNPLYPTQHVVKRKEMNAVRKKYSEFRKFARAMIKLQGDGSPMTEEFMASMWGSEETQLWQNILRTHLNKKPGLRVLLPTARTVTDTLGLIESGDTAKWADAVTYLCWTHQRWNTLWDLKTFDAALKTILTRTHADTVFEEKTITTGAWVKNPNERYIRQG